MIWILLLGLAVLLWSARRYLHGPDLRSYDRPTGDIFDTVSTDAEGLVAVNKTIGDWRREAESARGMRGRLTKLREQLDNLSADLIFDGEVIPVNADGVDAEWVIAPGANRHRRVLMIHGGAFCLGSARGHRKVSARLSALGDAAVLAINYRLAPEHHRSQCVDDSQTAYHWMLEQGPDGPAIAQQTLLAGDSAGGNLVLVLAAILRAQTLLQPAAVIALCPTVDSTMSAPSIIYNAGSDHVLGQFGKVASKVPRSLLLLLSTVIFKLYLANPRYSPIFGDLRGLPPTLIHASDTEILLSDAIRYTNKARSAGSMVDLQIWREQMHVWHLFADDLQATEQAWQEIGHFIKRHA